MATCSAEWNAGKARRVSEDPDKARPDKDREEARKKFFGRAMVLAFLVLVAAYVLATFVR